MTSLTNKQSGRKDFYFDIIVIPVRPLRGEHIFESKIIIAKDLAMRLPICGRRTKSKDLSGLINQDRGIGTGVRGREIPCDCARRLATDLKRSSAWVDNVVAHCIAKSIAIGGGNACDRITATNEGVELDKA